MEKVSTTLPLAPTGVTNPEIPLAVTGTLTKQPVSSDQLMLGFNFTDPNKWIYIDKFLINRTTAMATKIYTWESKTPLSSNFKPSYLDIDGSVTQIIPFSLVAAHYSRLSRIEWEIMLQPVKIGDCRVELDVIFDYGITPENSLDSLIYNKDNLHFKIDSSDDPKVFVVPMYWAQHSVHTTVPLFIFNSSAIPLTQFQPASYPSTTVSIYQRSRYVPNNLQTDSFEVLVFVRPIVQGLSGFNSRSVVNAYVNGSSDPAVPYLPQPYWIKNTINISLYLTSLMKHFKRQLTADLKISKSLIDSLSDKEIKKNALAEYQKIYSAIRAEFERYNTLNLFTSIKHGFK